MRHAGFFLIASTVAFVTLNVGANAENLGAAAIKHLVTGKTVYLATPLGGEMPLNYRASGKIDADGGGVGLGKFFKPRDSGRWWVTGDQLCQKWQTWYDGKTQCFTLESAGGMKLRWKQDNGDAGTARIGG